VKVTLRPLFAKLRVHNRTQAAVWFHAMRPKEQVLIKDNLEANARRWTRVEKGVSMIAAAPIGGVRRSAHAIARHRHARERRHRPACAERSRKATLRSSPSGHASTSISLTFDSPRLTSSVSEQVTAICRRSLGVELLDDRDIARAALAQHG
jgi:hypothetical protein